jgi:hypothetical protein
MKTIKTNDGQIIHGYELNDLDEQTKEKVMQEHGQFLYENTDCEDEEGNPKELDYPEDSVIIENIEINGYLFNDDGDILPTLYHMKNNKLDFITYGKKEIPCTIE